MGLNTRPMLKTRHLKFWEKEKGLVPNTLFINLSLLNIFAISIKVLLPLLIWWESQHLFKRHCMKRIGSKLWMRRWKPLQSIKLERLLRSRRARFSWQLVDLCKRYIIFCSSTATSKRGLLYKRSENLTTEARLCMFGERREGLLQVIAHSFVRTFLLGKVRSKV